MESNIHFLLQHLAHSYIKQLKITTRAVIEHISNTYISQLYNVTLYMTSTAGYNGYLL